MASEKAIQAARDSVEGVQDCTCDGDEWGGVGCYYRLKVGDQVDACLGAALDAAFPIMLREHAGFTREEVRLLEQAMEDAAAEARPYPEGIEEAVAPFRSLRDRIAALLPPESSPGYEVRDHK